MIRIENEPETYSSNEIFPFKYKVSYSKLPESPYRNSSKEK